MERKIEKIIIDYQKNKRVENSDYLELDHLEDDFYVEYLYKEKLIIDKTNQIVEHVKYIDLSTKIVHRIEIKNEIEIDNLFSNFESENLFKKVKGNPSDAVENVNNEKGYMINIFYDDNTQKLILGSFDKNGLPTDYPRFAEILSDYMRYYQYKEILDYDVYTKRKRRKSEYIFCKVAFKFRGKEYYYLTDSDDYEIGNLVLVPFGKDDEVKVAQITSVEYYGKENLPRSINNTKNIIRKYRYDDIALLEEMLEEDDDFDLN